MISLVCFFYTVWACFFVEVFCFCRIVMLFFWGDVVDVGFLWMWREGGMEMWMLMSVDGKPVVMIVWDVKK
ncbi:hypothetical protein BC829DRAFT_403704 [Chytridium lagenaria]|nr:hypothetical protein BC829DRAFT_403704 [Chytridium lagenaria]